MYRLFIFSAIFALQIFVNLSNFNTNPHPTMNSPTTFNRDNPPDSQQRLLVALNAQERQYVIAMAKRLGITFMQAARELMRQKEAAKR